MPAGYFELGRLGVVPAISTHIQYTSCSNKAVSTICLTKQFSRQALLCTVLLLLPLLHMKKMPVQTLQAKSPSANNTLTDGVEPDIGSSKTHGAMVIHTTLTL